MYLIINNDGSLKFAITNDYIMQGSNNVNYIDLAIAGRSPSLWTCDCLFTLPNDTTITLAGVYKEFTYSGEIYKGYRVYLSSAVLSYAGTLRITARTYNSNGDILYTYPFNQTINATSLASDYDAPITIAQYNSFMALLTTYINAYDSHLIRKYDTMANALLDISKLSTSEHILISNGTNDYAMYYKANAGDTTLTQVPTPTNWTDIYAYLGLTPTDLSHLSLTTIKGYIDKYDIEALNNNLITGILSTTLTLKDLSTLVSSVDFGTLFYTKSETYSKTESDNLFATITSLNAMSDNVNLALTNSQNALNKANSITNTYVFDTYDLMVADLLSASNTKYKVGDTLLIIDISVPDYWISAINTTIGTYGYYSLAELQTNLELYQTKADSTLLTNTKTIVGGINELYTNALNYITKNVSDLTNYYTISQIDTRLNSYQLIANMPTKLSQFENDTNYITKEVNNLTNYTLTTALNDLLELKQDVATMPTKLSQFTNDTNYITKAVSNLDNYTTTATLNNLLELKQDISTMPTKLSQFTNDSAFITNATSGLTNYTKTSDLTILLNAKLDITALPTNVSAFANDSGYLKATNYATATTGGTIIASPRTANETIEVKIDTTTHKLYAVAIPTLNVVLVDTLPSEGASGTLYLVPSASPESQNNYNEYVWVNSTWEELGTTQIDLTDYYTKEQVDTLFTNNNTTIASTYATKIENATKLNSSDFTGANIVSELDITPVNRATSDSEGNTINSTYATKTENSAKLNTSDFTGANIVSELDITPVNRATSDSEGNNIASTYEKGAYILSGAIAPNGTITFNTFTTSDLVSAITNKQRILFIPTDTTLPAITLQVQTTASNSYKLTGSYFNNETKINYDNVITCINSVVNGSYSAKSNPTYVLPTATADTLGGVKVGENLSITNGVLKAVVPAGFTKKTWLAENIYYDTDMSELVNNIRNCLITIVTKDYNAKKLPAFIVNVNLTNYVEICYLLGGTTYSLVQISKSTGKVTTDWGMGVSAIGTYLDSITILY